MSEAINEAVERLEALARFSSKSGAFGRAVRKAYEQPLRDDLRALLDDRRQSKEREAVMREALAEALFTADRLRKRVTPDWIGMVREVKDEWRAKATALTHSLGTDGEG